MEVIEELKHLIRPQVQLVGQDGNAFAIMGRVSRACREAGWSGAQIAKLMDLMQAGDYDNLLAVAMTYCDNVTPEDMGDADEDEDEEDEE